MQDMIRTFHTIGQGAFYTEEFYSNERAIIFTAVYDCGTNSVQTFLTDKISLFASKRRNGELKRRINIMFISHFHQDHISGLEYLLKVCYVENIILPLVHKNERILISLLTENKFCKELVLDPLGTIKEISENTNLIFLESNNEQEKDDNDKEIVFVENLKNNTKIRSGTSISDTNINWIYVPFNFEYKSNSPLLIVELSKLIPSFTTKNFLDFYVSDKKMKKRIALLYKKLQKKDALNENSLVVYSGNNDQTVDCYSYTRNKIFKDDKYINKEGCIYMGDYNAEKGDNLSEYMLAYSKYYQNVCVIQIPHHGSIENFDSRLIKPIIDTIAVISARSTSTKHPSSFVLNSIINNGCHPITVTEMNTSYCNQSIGFYVK